MKTLLTLFVLFFSINVFAKTYSAHGDIMAQVCSWTFKCKMERLDFVISETSEGVIHKKIKRIYQSTEINEIKDGVCWITYKYRSGGFVNPPTYFDYYMKGFGQNNSDGSYKLIKPEYVWFKCK